MLNKVPTRWINISSKYLMNLQSTPLKEKWDLVSSVCLERKPMITKELTDIELEYSKLLSKIEQELSCKSDHELRKIKDKLLAEQFKKENTVIDPDQISSQTAQEYEDLCNEELKKFTLANRVTDDDLKENLKSTNRKLSDSLIFVSKQTLGNKSIWVLPQGIRQEGETLRQTAERVLTEICGQDLRAKFLGNAPSGFYKFRYPKKIGSTSVGMKIFYFKAQYITGSVSNELCKDFLWLSPKELDILQDDYLKSIKTILVENE